MNVYKGKVNISLHDYNRIIEELNSLKNEVELIRKEGKNTIIYYPTGISSIYTTDQAVKELADRYKLVNEENNKLFDKVGSMNHKIDTLKDLSIFERIFQYKKHFEV